MYVKHYTGCGLGHIPVNDAGCTVSVAIGIQANMGIRTGWYENKHFVRAKVQKGGQTCQKSGQMSYDGIKSKKKRL